MLPLLFGGGRVSNLNLNIIQTYTMRLVLQIPERYLKNNNVYRFYHKTAIFSSKTAKNRAKNRQKQGKNAKLSNVYCNSHVGRKWGNKVELKTTKSLIINNKMGK
jgi:hypothetical protein